MQFHVGMRVRVVGSLQGAEDSHEVPIGAEGVIVSNGRGGCWHWIVDLHVHEHSPGSLPSTHWGFYEEHLAPLTDPKAEQFLQSIRDIVADPMKPLPMEVEELARVRGGV